MRRLNHQEKSILQLWHAEFQHGLARLHTGVRERIESTKKGPLVTIWLGGPNSNHPLYRQRILIRHLLRGQGFKVIFSEDYRGRFDLASRELMEFEAIQMAVILSISPGAAGEAIDFAHITDMHNKLYIFCPAEYKRGYVYQSLSKKHRVTDNDKLFSLKKFEQFNSALPLKILDAAINFRLDLERRRRQRHGQLGS